MRRALDYTIELTSDLAIVTFDDPQTRNALTRETRIELVEDLRQLDRDPSVRTIIITGKDPSFTSGVNTKQLFGDPGYVAPLVDPPTALRGLSTPVIAAINGACYSGGLEIALACSFIIASDRATFADTHAKIGITPGWSLSAELPARIGIGRARQLAFTGMAIDASTALDWALVNEVVPHTELLGRARELASAIASISTDSIGNAVGLYRRIHEDQVAAARAIELETLTAWTVDAVASRGPFGSRADP